MKLSVILGFLSFLALALPFASGNPMRGHHNEVAHRARGDVNIHKRGFPSVRLTWYEVGLGACGTWSRPSDYIVALNVEQFGPGYPGEYCFRWITIQIGSKFVEAIITDKCMGCPWGGLDLSTGLFSEFAPLSEGVLTADWWFI